MRAAVRHCNHSIPGSLDLTLDGRWWNLEPTKHCGERIREVVREVLDFTPGQKNWHTGVLADKEHEPLPSDCDRLCEPVSEQSGRGRRISDGRADPGEEL